MIDLTPRDLQRFLSKIRKLNNCWVWQGTKSKNGYGLFRLYNKNILAHRLSYELFVGEIPKNLQTDHLCRNRLCVNTNHLEPVSCKENVLRGIGLASINKQKTHCSQGHEFTPENTYIDNKNKRKCKECNKTRSRNWARNNKLKFLEKK